MELTPVPTGPRSLVRRATAIGLLLVALAATATLVVPGIPTRAQSFSGGASSPTLPPGSALPTGAQCAQRVGHGVWEPRPENTVANFSVPQNLSLPPWPDYYEPVVNSRFVPRIDGDFRGTTDAIIAWGACKWGFDADVVRAMAVEESYWRQSHTGDLTNDPQHCVGGATVPCPTSFGLLQIKHIFRPGSYPYSALHTAFNVDYALGVLRACYEGWVIYLEGDYRPGDLWGCVGWHYSGEWKDLDAFGYIGRVEDHLAAKPWLKW